ncbi:velvet factor-domain-containing protein [Cokeromyces recurvatus]|uniref:velvet factor-domain-containing protein n=1 Tax=Cokeromyces recurvatus TaxID=90255 RepID=UPI00221FD643|nr:velvet factor-domain-containing protein [Cokeromyces recurvatus]KAI7901111.1 velvet factor-domain-containing protein [Cokeromyces recurvatus]
MDESVYYHFATVKQRIENRHEIEYQLILRQQPKQSRMCGIGEKADRRPIDPPPIVQLKVIDPSLSPYEKNSYLQNPYYFMYASLMAADLDEELHLLKDGRTRSTTGSVVSSLYHLKDIDNTDAGFFVFPDLSVRMEGSYRLKLSLFEIIGKDVFHCRSIISNKFFVYSAKKFPGMEESTFLSRSFADQGLKIRIRKELRQRRKLKNNIEERNRNNIPISSHSSLTQIGKRIKISKELLPNASTAATTTTISQYRNDLLPGPIRYLSYSPREPDTEALPLMISPIQNTVYHSRQENTNNIESSNHATISRERTSMTEDRQPTLLHPTQNYFPVEIPPIYQNRSMSYRYQNDLYHHSQEAHSNPSNLSSFRYAGGSSHPSSSYYPLNYPLPLPYSVTSSSLPILPRQQQSHPSHIQSSLPPSLPPPTVSPSNQPSLPIPSSQLHPSSSVQKPPPEY